LDAAVEIDSILSGLGGGRVIDLNARILVPSMQPIGCLMTILLGVVGGAAGGLLGSAAGWGFWLTFATQIVIAAILVAIVAALFRRGDAGS